MTIEAFPLCWPTGRPRMPSHARERARFDTSLARARDEIMRQIEMMTGRYDWMRRETGLVISTNLQLRRDGLPMASQSRVQDPGVAVYFNYKKRPMCFACDRWDRIEDNMQAIAKTIDALRGVARWGTGDMMEAAFTGFTALPSAVVTPPNWRTVLRCPEVIYFRDVEAAYMRRRKEAHPDHGGQPGEFDQVQRAWEQARQEFGS